MRDEDEWEEYFECSICRNQIPVSSVPNSITGIVKCCGSPMGRIRFLKGSSPVQGLQSRLGCIISMLVGASVVFWVLYQIDSLFPSIQTEDIGPLVLIVIVLVVSLIVRGIVDYCLVRIRSVGHRYIFLSVIFILTIFGAVWIYHQLSK